LNLWGVQDSLFFLIIVDYFEIKRYTLALQNITPIK